jgi:hypothetical protein
LVGAFVGSTSLRLSTRYSLDFEETAVKPRLANRSISQCSRASPSTLLRATVSWRIIDPGRRNMLTSSAVSAGSSRCSNFSTSILISSTSSGKKSSKLTSSSK